MNMNAAKLSFEYNSLAKGKMTFSDTMKRVHWAGTTALAEQ